MQMLIDKVERCPGHRKREHSGDHGNTGHCARASGNNLRAIVQHA